MFPNTLFKCADTSFQKTGILLRQSLFSEKLEAYSVHTVHRVQIFPAMTHIQSILLW